MNSCCSWRCGSIRAAHDEAAVKEANRTATRAAVADALTAHPADVVLDVAARREQAHNAFFGEGS